MRFLLGPAGSGKTFRCMAEIRAALMAEASSEGPENQKRPGGTPGPLAPLVFIAPKQATFQLERQLLGGDAVAGFTRLNVLSFDRLAQFVFENLHIAPPRLLSAEGRIMVLRALLRKHEGELKLLRGSARRYGFAQELGGQLAELQQHQFAPARLRALAGQENLRRELRDKLHDLALLLEKYTDWLAQHDLQDANCLLDFATDALRSALSAPLAVGEVGSGSENQMPTLPSPLLPRGRRGGQTVPERASFHSFVIEHLWLDGFAEMTPQEQALLTAIVPFCRQATLAFCLETEPTPAPSWLSIWSAIGKTFQRCRTELAALPGCLVETEVLRRTAGKNRFAENSALAILEEGWALPMAAEFEVADLPAQISVTACANPEAEALYAARELLKYVRAAKGNRFRDCAVLVRSLGDYHQPLARIFHRYEIPFFLDRRESVTHHPLAELTRNALRTIAGDWEPEDWFATLKAGFTDLSETNLDRLENRALESGWRGKKWREPLPDEEYEPLRLHIFPPFEKLHRRLQRQQFRPTGVELVEAIEELWADLEVEPTLEKWSLAAKENATAGSQVSLHETVFAQMLSWLENVAMAFPREPLPLQDWLPILDAGLAGLTVGVIPPALDEVLVGAIDRARNPDLKFALLLGVNESVFPAAPAAPVILTNSDRDELDKQSVSIGLDVLNQISRERYLGYIACTRASQRLAVTFARQNGNGKALNPSPFVAHLQKNFKQLEIEEFSSETGWLEAEHASELIPKIVELNGPSHESQADNLKQAIDESPENKWFNARPHPGPLPRGEGEQVAANWQNAHTGSKPVHRNALGALIEIPALKLLAEKIRQLREPDERENVSSALAEKIYGAVLTSSVSRLEEFAQCPMRFFVHSGLRAEERKQFELNARERGSFQHEILKIFHDKLVAEGKRWRDITPPEARERIGQIAAAFAPDYREGLFRADDRSRFTARALTLALQDFVETLVRWMRGQYDFDPVKAETGFGMEETGLPAWSIDLEEGHKLALRGRVDRVDLARDGDRSLAVVMDYKSSVKKLDRILVEHGVQLQLLAYLATVRRWPAEFFGVEKIVPAGVFYVNLRGQFEGGGSRTEVLAEAEASRRLAYRHSGRFDAGFLSKLDRQGAHDQFNYQLNQDGSLRARSAEALACKDFTGLLDQVEEQLRTLGRRIYTGEAAVDPYRKGGLTPCAYCDYRAVCRIDEWTHEFRDLRAKEEIPAAA